MIPLRRSDFLESPLLAGWVLMLIRLLGADSVSRAYTFAPSELDAGDEIRLDADLEDKIQTMWSMGKLFPVSSLSGITDISALERQIDGWGESRSMSLRDVYSADSYSEWLGSLDDELQELQGQLSDPLKCIDRRIEIGRELAKAKGIVSNAAVQIDNRVQILNEQQERGQMYLEKYGIRQGEVKAKDAEVLSE